MHAELRSARTRRAFRREANIALQLSHDAIAQTVALEEIDRELVLLQELVHGIDLRLLETRAATAGERVPLPIALHIVSEIARALAHAHAFADLAIVHRDVTPDNVMLAFSGEVKLVDFGIARSNADAMLTRTGHIVGRPTYTAPEVWEGEQADRRADTVFAGRRAVAAVDRAAPRTRRERAMQRPVAMTRRLPAAPDRRRRAGAGARIPTSVTRTRTSCRKTLRRFLPADFGAKPALAELIARYFDVARERQMLADDVARARRFLSAPNRRRRVAIAAHQSRGGCRDAARWVAAGVAAAVGGQSASRACSRCGREPTSWCTGSRVQARTAGRPAPASTRRGRHATRHLPHRPLVRRQYAERTTPPTRGHLRAHQMAASAGRARPPSREDRAPRTIADAEELLRRAQEKFDVGETEARSRWRARRPRRRSRAGACPDGQGDDE